MPRRVVDPLIGRDRRRLGRAIDLKQRHAALQVPAHERLVDDRRAGGDRAQPRQVGARPARLARDQLELRRHQHRQRDAVVDERVDGLRRIEPRVQHDRRAAMQRGQRLDVEPADVEQRQRGQHDIVADEIVHVGAIDRVVEQRVLRQHHAFGLTRGTRRVAKQHRRRVTHVGRPRRRRCAACEEPVVRQPAVVPATDRHADRTPWPDRRCRRWARRRDRRRRAHAGGNRPAWRGARPGRAATTAARRRRRAARRRTAGRAARCRCSRDARRGRRGVMPQASSAAAVRAIARAKSA